MAYRYELIIQPSKYPMRKNWPLSVDNCRLLHRQQGQGLKPLAVSFLVGFNKDTGTYLLLSHSRNWQQDQSHSPRSAEQEIPTNPKQKEAAGNEDKKERPKANVFIYC